MITLGLNTTSHPQQPTEDDIETGLYIYSIFFYCPKETSKLGMFLHDLVMNATPRTLLLTVVNSLNSNLLTTKERTMLGEFYKVLGQVMNLKMGKIMLALSSNPSTLQSAEELPYLEEYSGLIEQCVSEANCSAIKSLIGTLGKYLIALFFNKISRPTGKRSKSSPAPPGG